ncbi:TetR/AcrR family transcriptional regulator [Thalassotalea ganghwensis]
MSIEKSHYHHGDLKASMIKTAKQMLENDGIQALSLRKIAEQVGVSRTAAYHHFANKHELLSAVASEGFEAWQHQVEAIFGNEKLTAKQRFKAFFQGYIHFAIEHPHIYSLMFGETLWKHQHNTEQLNNVAYPSFEQQVKMTQYWQSIGVLPAQENSLRLAQVIWGTLHGIATLVLDGIYTKNTNIDEMCDCAFNLFTGFSNN